MANAGGRGHHHSRPRHLGAPAQVDVLTEQVHLGVEAAQGPEQVRPHEGATSGYGEDLPHLVVLGLIELAGLDALDAGAETVDAQAHLEQPVRRLPLDELRAHDAGIRAIGLAHHAADRVGRRGHVVVADQKVRRPLDGEQRLVRRHREPACLAPAENVGAGSTAATRAVRSSWLAASTTSTSRFG